MYTEKNQINPNNFIFRLLLSTIFLTVSYSVLRCDEVETDQLHFLPKAYFRVKPCYRLNRSIIARSRSASFSRCLNYAIEKKGLAFNYSPKKKSENDDEDFFFMNCEVLSCPDVDNLTSLVNDSRFDYYTLYGNTEALINGSCVPQVGVFKLSVPGANYSAARNACMSSGSYLAHIVSASRSKGLGALLASRKLPWKEARYPLPWDSVAYVGLTDQKQEGLFVTERDEPLDCFRYRAWAPGHPRKNRKKDDCVIIDDDQTWRAVNCAKKLPYFCELIPRAPYWQEYQEFTNVTCSDFTNRTMKRRCKRIQRKYKQAIEAVDYEEEMLYEDRCEEI